MREKAIFGQKLRLFFLVFVLRLKGLYILCTQKYVYTNIQTEECTRPCHL